MESLFLLIPLSLLLVGLAIWVFLRMSETGQFDDMEGPAHSILMDDDRPRPSEAGQSPAAPTDRQPSARARAPRTSAPRND